MKLAAVFNVWGDWDMLKYSYANIENLVDGVIIIASTKSNHGEYCEIPDEWKDKVIIREPIHHVPMHSETEKRNYGLMVAKAAGYTHFLMLDADEFYEPLSFIREKNRFITDPNLQGLVCASRVYVKSPNLSIGLDTTLVPFIHKITPSLKHEFNKNYPFAWEGRSIRVDPTRSLNISSGVEWSNIVMEHYSWVRKDIPMKIRNSTAKANLERMNLMKNFFQLKEGDVFDLYPGKPLVRVPDKFGIPADEFMEVQNIQSVEASSAAGV